jgi:hypothetical protein
MLRGACRYINGLRYGQFAPTTSGYQRRLAVLDIDNAWPATKRGAYTVPHT